LLGAWNFGRGSAREGMVVEGVKGVKYTTKTPEMYKNGKNGQFPIFIDLKIEKNRFLLKST
jgi:hypothetical protein